MALLLDVYNDMMKAAEEAEVNKVMQERIEWLSKYAALATELLNAEFPNNYTKEDVTMLADRLIESEVEHEIAVEKQAEAVELLSEYVKTARALLEEEYKTDFTEKTVEKLASTLFELSAEVDFNKEAESIAEFAFLDQFNKSAGTEYQSLTEIEEALKTANMMESMKPAYDATMKGLKSLKGYAKSHPVAAAGATAGIAGAGMVAGSIDRLQQQKRGEQ